ncbi:MAG: helix-turn-helix transcriptional regulator [Mariprofundales bacterium]
MGKVNQHVNSPLPARLKAARLAKGLSQKGLGIAAGMDAFSASPRMNHYERGRHAPDFVTLRKLARLLDVPTAYFYAEEDWLAECLVRLCRMKPEQRLHLLLEHEADDSCDQA